MKYQSIKLVNLFKITAFAFVILLCTQCSKYQGDNKKYAVNSSGNGAQVVPASASSASGLMTGEYDSHNNTLSGVINWTGLSGGPTAIHFHGFANPGGNNIYQFVLDKVPAVASGSMNFQSAFTGAQEGSLIQGTYYYDIHTAAFPNGEIRGQILLQ